MEVSTLTLALSVFQKNGLRVIDVNKTHADNFHLYYKKDGKTRVMLVPKKCDDNIKLQSEVEILLSRNYLEQDKLGKSDGLKLDSVDD